MPNNMLPAIFFGHGNPLNAIGDNIWTKAWRRIGDTLPKPRAVVMVSAHWYGPGVGVTVDTSPQTIHDFGGFPRELYDVTYPAPGDPALARQVQQILSPLPVRLDGAWGLDHGTWSVLRHVWPDADVPVVQLSIDKTQPAAFHYELGRKLAPLRSEGILIAGSGNVVHSLHHYAWARGDAKPADWAVRFEQRAKALMREGDDPSLVNYESLGRDAVLSIPTPDHYLPLLYVLGTRSAADSVTFPTEGIEGASMSMLSVQLGP